MQHNLRRAYMVDELLVNVGGAVRGGRLSLRFGQASPWSMSFEALGGVRGDQRMICLAPGLVTDLQRRLTVGRTPVSHFNYRLS